MDFKLIENKWQGIWAADTKTTATINNSDKPKKYVLVEFPYPSGSGLHVGHAFSFTGGDVCARFWRMKGYNVLFPMGWDAFGLPTENYAIKTKQKPQKVTKDNTDMFKSQMKKLAFSFDWNREVNTTDPEYYKWTQWIFVKLFEKGLAYKKEMPINWCPSCKIGLANEEVVDGKCERCGAEVERRTISQWVVKITEYADKLIEGLKETDFIEKVKAAQINWIGKSEGAKISFQLSVTSDQLKTKTLEVFTTRPDTLYGVTFMVISPEHELVNSLITNDQLPITNEKKEEIRNYIKIARGKSELERTELNKEKTGVFSGLYAINPVTEKEIPIWISDFVLASYGTGAIMAVPAHDERDFAFAKKFGLEIKPVIDNGKHDFEKEAMTSVDEGKMINSPNWNGLKPSEAIKQAVEWLKEKGIGEGTASYHLRDWIFSRQHYWGEPIPMIYCEECAKNHNLQSSIFNLQIKKYAAEKKIEEKILLNNPGWYPVEESLLPVRLPEVEAYEPTDDGKSPLSKIESFVKTVCPVCGKEAKRETDTMPNWAGSDWYFMRYCDPHNNSCLAQSDLLKKWMPVDVYIGGDEHNTLHLLYSRFIYEFLHDLGVVPKEIAEPYFKRISHGVILGPDNQRMSKSHGNVIVPETVADKYGVDVLRMYLMFMGPFDGTMAWNEKTLMGVKRFLDRFEKTIVSYQLRVANDSSDEVKVVINKLVKGVGEDISSFKYNTAIAKMMEGINKLSVKSYELRVEDLKTLIKVIAPFAPYMAEELWNKLDIGGSVHASEWPRVEEAYLAEETINIPVAVNGKVRETIEIDRKKTEEKDYVLEMAKSNEKIKPWLIGKRIVREIYIPGKMLNMVLA